MCAILHGDNGGLVAKRWRRCSLLVGVVLSRDASCLLLVSQTHLALDSHYPFRIFSSCRLTYAVRRRGFR